MPSKGERTKWGAIYKDKFQREEEVKMGIVTKAGDLTFKAFVGALGVTTIWLTGTFSVNVYRGLAWHKSQSKLEENASEDQST